MEPQFSSTDLDTFLNFPYDSKGNCFILIDPVPNVPYFKVFKIIIDENNKKVLQHVPWIEYTPIKYEYEKTDLIYGLNELSREERPHPTDDPYTPPKIEDLDKNKSTKKKNDVNHFFS